MTQRWVQGGVGRAATVFVVAALLAACAALEDDSRPLSVNRSREQRELSLQREWIGRTRDDLVRIFGAPRLVMDIPGNRVPESIILVYRNRDLTGQCIDAFVILKEEPQKVADYFCR